MAWLLVALGYLMMACRPRATEGGRRADYRMPTRADPCGPTVAGWRPLTGARVSRGPGGTLPAP